MLKRLLKKHPYKLSLLWALIIFGLCSMPGRFIPTTSWLELLSFDKWVHAGIFFVLSFLLFTGVAVHQQDKKFTWIWFFAAILYGGLLEILQAKVFSERSADWQDFIANSFGCLCAFALQEKIIAKLIR